MHKIIYTILTIKGEAMKRIRSSKDKSSCCDYCGILVPCCSIARIQGRRACPSCFEAEYSARQEWRAEEEDVRIEENILNYYDAVVAEGVLI
jgi:hypothetical protein